MNIKDILKKDSVILNVHCNNKEDAINKLIERHYECGHIKDKELYKQAILARESLSSTGVGNMIAIPHAQDDTVNYPSLVAMVDKEGADFESLDQQPAKIFFMIAVPKDGGSQHLDILAKLCQILMDEKITNALLKAGTPQQFIDILTGGFHQEKAIENSSKYDIVAVTACPTGIAHTYMAAKALEDTAKEKNISIKVETNGASGIKNKLNDEDIENAKCVIIAADKKVETNRFNGKYVIQVPVAKGIHNANELLDQAMRQEASIFTTELEEKSVEDVKGIKKIYKHLMNGISQVIPLLMIYGVLISVLGQESHMYYNQDASIFNLYTLRVLVDLIIIFSLPVLSAFIADSISDKPGFIVAFASSILVVYVDNIGAIGVIIIGFVAGYLVKLLKKLFSYIPEDFSSLVPNLLIPICGVVIMTFVLNMIIGIPFNLKSIISQSVFSPVVALIVGLILGIMMSIDMGGPVNKTAYTIGIICIYYGKYDIMSAVMLAGMIPPIVIWLSMLVSPKLFDSDEIKNKWKCLIKGLCFVSEEAIPYMSKDKKGIHLPCIIASGVAGALSLYFGCSQMFPHGGIVTLPLIKEPLLFVISLLASVVIGMSFVLLFKKPKDM